MIPSRTPEPTSARSTRRAPDGRRIARAACVALVAAVAWGASGTTVSAAPAGVEAPAATTAMVGLGVGARGAGVRDLQQGLIDAGIVVPGGADGIFGPATRGAVRSFQERSGLAVTGEVDSQTAVALAGGTASTSNGTTRLSAGATGDSVRELQRRLSDMGAYVAGGADGVFGPGTTRALTQFQRWNGLTPSGSVDAATADRLGLGAAAATPAATPAPVPGPVVAAAPDGYAGLAVGSRGDLVKDLQRALQSTGLVLRGGADGVFGNATASALKAFQSVNGISQTGVLTARGAELLELGSTPAPTPVVAVAPAPAPAPSEGNPYVGLSIGARGELVREVQNALIGLGLTVSGGADGVFGGATASALKAFQSVNGINQTGVVTDRGADLLRLGTGEVTAAPTNTNSSAVRLERFPVQGLCFFGDTWHAARGGGRLHEGVDVIAAEGKLLYAVADGEITKLYWDQPGLRAGNGMRLTQPDGTYFVYLHLLAFAPGLGVGTKVKAGDVIGFVGNTGSSATAHLHFEIHPGGGAAINPYPYIKAMDECRNTDKQFQSSFS